MILGKKAPGRPFHVAVLPPLSNRVTVHSDFYRVAKSLNYTEIMALARALRLTQRTVYAWHYGERIPRRWGIMLDVIQWGKDGKPLVRLYQSEKDTDSMF